MSSLGFEMPMVELSSKESKIQSFLYWGTKLFLIAL